MIVDHALSTLGLCDGEDFNFDTLIGELLSYPSFAKYVKLLSRKKLKEYEVWEIKESKRKTGETLKECTNLFRSVFMKASKDKVSLGEVQAIFDLEKIRTVHEA